MAEILHPLSSSGLWQHQPMRELGPSSQEDIYEVVGDHLDEMIDNGQKVMPGAFLLLLDNGQRVAFEFNVATSMEEGKEDRVAHQRP